MILTEAYGQPKLAANTRHAPEAFPQPNGENYAICATLLTPGMCAVTVVGTTVESVLPGAAVATMTSANAVAMTTTA